MKNFADIQKLAEHDLNERFQTSICENIKIGYDSFLQFINENKDFITFWDKEKTVLGYLRSLSIEKALDMASYLTFSPYKCDLIEVNKYKYKALCLETDNFLLNICRTQKKSQFPPKSNYRLKFSHQNEPYDMQQTMFDDENLTSDKLYAIITYNFLHDDLSHAEIMIPKKDFTGLLYHINILDRVKDKPLIIPEEEKEKQIITLKKELSKKLKLLK